MKRFLLFFAILLTLTSWIHTEAQAAQDMVASVENVPTEPQNSPYNIHLKFKRGTAVVAVKNIVAAANADQIPLGGNATIAMLSGTTWSETLYYNSHWLTITPEQGSTPALGFKGEVTLEFPAGVIVDPDGNTSIKADLNLGFIDTRAPSVIVYEPMERLRSEAYEGPFNVPISLFYDADESLALDIKDIDVTSDGDGTFELELTAFRNATEFERETGLNPIPESVLSTSSAKYYKVTVTPVADENGIVPQGNATITVSRGAVRDPAGNGNAKSKTTVPVGISWIPDPALKAVLQEALAGKPLTPENVANLTELNASSRGIQNLSGLKTATNLEFIDLSGNDIKAIDALDFMTSLTTLNLANNNIEQLRPLRLLTNLRTLVLQGNERISDLTPLEDLANLVTLNLRDNAIIDVTPLAGLTTLTYLDLTNNLIQDVSPLASLTTLATLRIGENLIKDLSVLRGLTATIDTEGGQDAGPPSFIPDENLRKAIRTQLDLAPKKRLTPTILAKVTTLQLASSSITNLTGLEHATKLTTLDLKDNTITNITPLRGLTTLTTLDLSQNSITDIAPLLLLQDLTTLDLSNNPISNLSGLEKLTALGRLELRSLSIQNLGVLSTLTGLTRLDLGNNSIKNLQPLSGLTALVHLSLSKNAISDATPLKQLRKLRNLNLSDNNLRDISPLASLTSLYYLHLKRNSINDVQSLARLTKLLKLNLEGNSILDTSPLWPLTKRTSPTLIDITVNRYPPWDVDKDGVVDHDDYFLVRSQFAPSLKDKRYTRYDVNRDGSIDQDDLDLIWSKLDSTEHNLIVEVLAGLENAPTVRGAPSILALSGLLDPEMLDTLNRATLKGQLDKLLAESDGSLKYLQAIKFLQNLLALLTPEETLLLANYPNPFNPETWIPYQLANASDVEIFIYDARGTLVRHLSLGHQHAGYYRERSRAAYWDGRNTAGERVASGIYFYRLQADNASFLRKMLILK